MTVLASVARPSESTVKMEICPRCEGGILATVEVPHEVVLAGAVVRIPRVQAEECLACGYRALSGREVRLFEVLFAPQYQRVADLVAALRAARYTGMFLREDRAGEFVGYAARSYVDGLEADLRELYLDNESSHVLQGLSGTARGVVAIDVAGSRCRVVLPRLGEGENGVVFERVEDPATVLKLAKPRPYSREHLRQERELTSFFQDSGVPVPRVLESDGYGSYLVKERLRGRALASLYGELGHQAGRRALVREAVRAFVARLLALFDAHPEAKTSISPNNIFVAETGGRCECLLVDTGPAPFHDYSAFDFDRYWDVVVPQKIGQYRAVGYL